ncbi:hypothetical protein EC991_007448, partial [Linnemannia zychae]
AYDSVPEEERCFFEQIREGKACKEYHYIEWTLASSADECEIQRLEQQVFAAFFESSQPTRNQHAPKFALDDEHYRVLSASNSKMMSRHIVIPTCVFENNSEHMTSLYLRSKALRVQYPTGTPHSQLHRHRRLKEEPNHPDP